VNLSVATQTKSYTVPYIKAMIGEFGEGEYVMRVKIAAMIISAVLASPVITGEDRVAPRFILNSISDKFIFWCYPTPPVPKIFSRVRPAVTFVRAVFAAADFKTGGVNKKYSLAKFTLLVDFFNLRFRITPF
jgi:hypothetical protein